MPPERTVRAAGERGNARTSGLTTTLATSAADHRHVLVLVENKSYPADGRVRAETRALTAAGYLVSVVCPTGSDRDRELVATVDGVKVHRYPLRESGGGLRGYLVEYASALRHMRRLAQKIDAERRVDVVHLCNPPDVLFLAVGRLRRRGARVVYDQHDLVPELFEARFGRRPRLLVRAARLFERLTYRAATVVISPNESYRRVALTRGDKLPEDVFVVRNAPDASRFRPRAADADASRRDGYLIAYAGTIGPQDGVDHALRALALLGRRREDWRAVFAGGGDWLGDAIALASELGLAGRVEFCGHLDKDDLIALLQGADVCLSPEPKNALNDSSTMIKVGEYMALAKPIVAYDLAETRLSAGEAAIYARPNDPASLADAVSDLLDDEPRRRSMGASGRSRIEGELGWRHSVAALESAYARALGA